MACRGQRQTRPVGAFPEPDFYLVRILAKKVHYILPYHLSRPCFLQYIFSLSLLALLTRCCTRRLMLVM